MAAVTTEDRQYTSDNKQIVSVTFTADSSGNASRTVALSGFVFRVVTNPGTPAPTANYDITLIDIDGIDTIQNLLQNRHTINSEEVTFCGANALTVGPPIHVNGNYVLTVANAGNGGNGVIRFYIV